jgi:hypothetical protein
MSDGIGNDSAYLPQKIVPQQTEEMEPRGSNCDTVQYCMQSRRNCCVRLANRKEPGRMVGVRLAAREARASTQPCASAPLRSEPYDPLVQKTSATTIFFNFFLSPHTRLIYSIVPSEQRYVSGVQHLVLSYAPFTRS